MRTEANHSIFPLQMEGKTTGTVTAGHNQTLEKESTITTEIQGGLSKREYFAGLAMQGLLASPVISKLSEAHPDRITGALIAKQAVIDADALILELNK